MRIRHCLLLCLLFAACHQDQSLVVSGVDLASPPAMADLVMVPSVDLTSAAPDLAGPVTHPDLASAPDLMPLCPVQISATIADPSKEMVVMPVGTHNVLFATMAISATGSGVSLNNAVHVILSEANGSPAFMGDVQNLTLVNSSGAGVSDTLMFCVSVGNDLDCAFHLQGEVALNQVLSLELKGDTGQPGNVMLGQRLIARLILADSTFTYQGHPLDASCIQSTTEPLLRTGTAIVPFMVNVNADAPTPGSAVTQFVGTGTSIGRFKIINNGNAPVEITGATFTDQGHHTGSNTLYELNYSSENTPDYTVYTARTNSVSVDFSNLQSKSFPINGGAFRFATVRISSLGSGKSGDAWLLSVAHVGDVQYSVTEADLGYDGNMDGDLSDTIVGLPVDGHPTLGLITAQ